MFKKLVKKFILGFGSFIFFLMQQPPIVIDNGSGNLKAYLVIIVYLFFFLCKIGVAPEEAPRYNYANIIGI
jgi:hypothetical protein